MREIRMGSKVSILPVPEVELEKTELFVDPFGRGQAPFVNGVLKFDGERTSAHRR
jgi:hypothetical protein